MSLIVTITPNPCIDTNSSVPELLPDKKLQCTYCKSEPGGGGINVSRVITRLGGKTIAVYIAGGYNGNFLTDTLQKDGIESIVIKIKENTRQNFIVMDESTGLQYRFGMPGPTIKETELQECLQTIDALHDVSFVVASGSLSTTCSPDFFARIAAMAKNKKIKMIVDTSGKALQYALDAGVYLIKPNWTELCSLANADEGDEETVLSFAQNLIAQKKTEAIVVSKGAAGAILITKNNIQHFTAPQIKVKSNVGAGDSMVAGIVHFLSQGKSLTNATIYGIACGAAATLNIGSELCHKEDIEKLYAQLLDNIKVET